MTPLQFVSQLQSVKLENVFNPYFDHCNSCDGLDASDIRSRSLLALLRTAQEIDIDMLWIGRDLGYRGGRRTGLAFTDDVHLSDHSKRWRLTFERPTIGKMVKEMSAMFVWRVLNQLDAKIVLWNLFPLHPHNRNNPFSNRKHNKRECCIGEEFLVELVALLRPEMLIPIGNDAAAATERIFDKSKIHPVRHPSYGGFAQFQNQMLETSRLLRKQ